MTVGTQGWFGLLGDQKKGTKLEKVTISRNNKVTFVSLMTVALVIVVAVLVVILVIILFSSCYNLFLVPKLSQQQQRL